MKKLNIQQQSINKEINEIKNQHTLTRNKKVKK